VIDNDHSAQLMLSNSEVSCKEKRGLLKLMIFGRNIEILYTQKFGKKFLFGLINCG